MNIQTFQDAVKSRKATLAHDLDHDLDEEEDVKALQRDVEGEEEEGAEKVTNRPPYPVV
jgi:hypothetical protein